VRKEVYNLEFSSECPEMTIFGYRFTRVDDYQDKIASLQHLITSYSEFAIHANTGKHAVTAYVEIPEREKEAALAWAYSSESALSDIMLLLSIFTRRDVFALDRAIDDGTGKVIIADPRLYPSGGVLGASIPYEERLIDPTNSLSSYNIGFEKCLNHMYELIRTEEWKARYERGYFLFLAQQAFRSRSPNITFTLCWVIWEHLFAILNREWLPEHRLRQIHIHPSDKVVFLLVEYEIKPNMTAEDRKQIEKWVKIRNGLVHFGCVPEGDPKHGTSHSSAYDPVYDDVISFIRLTEFIIAKILKLSPSHALNTKKMDDFLKV
jgi:hypothetical protein